AERLFDRRLVPEHVIFGRDWGISTPRIITTDQVDRPDAVRTPGASDPRQKTAGKVDRLAESARYYEISRPRRDQALRPVHHLQGRNRTFLVESAWETDREQPGTAPQADSTTMEKRNKLYRTVGVLIG